MEQTVHAQASYYSGIATAGLVIAVIALIIIIGLLIAFFVERNLFLFPRYNVLPKDGPQAISGTSNTNSFTAGAGDTTFIFAQAATGAKGTALALTINSSSNNAKGQFLYIFYQRYNSSGGDNLSDAVTVSITAPTIDVKQFKISGGQTGIYFIDSNNSFKFMGVTSNNYAP